MTSNSKIGYLLKEVTKGIIVQQVNAQGQMGSGIALAIKTKWPIVYDRYVAEIKQDTPDKGLSYMGHVIYVEVEPDLWIANIVGQQFYGRDKSRVYTSYEALEMGFHSVKHFAKNKELDVHYPTIGCGLANGDWTRVSQLIAEQLDTINHTLWQMPE